MGLDSYLYKKTYVKNWDMMSPEQKHEIVVKKDGKPVEYIKPERISEITEEVAYWRKFNALHRWFVNKCQGGTDDCKEYYVSRADLRELLTVLKTIDKDHSKAEKLLPPQEGFFFGGTNYDEWYFSDVSFTIPVIEGLLKEPEKGDFYYSSSW